MTRFDSSILVVAALLVLLVIVKSVVVRQNQSSFQEVNLNDLIHRLSSELKNNAEDMAKKKDATLFYLSEAEVEINFVLKQASTIGAEASVFAVAVKAGDDYGQEVTHKIKIKLLPSLPQSGESPPEERVQK